MVSSIFFFLDWTLERANLIWKNISERNLSNKKHSLKHRTGDKISQWVAISGTSGSAYTLKCHFFGYNDDFLITGGIKGNYVGLNESQDLMVWTLVSDMVYPLPLWLIKWRKSKNVFFQFFKHYKWRPKELPAPSVFCWAVFGWSNTCIYNSNLWPNGVYQLAGVKIR